MSRLPLAAILFAVLTVCALVASGVLPIVADLAVSDVPTADATGDDGNPYAASLETAVAADPDDETTLASLARLRALAGTTREAIALYERLIAIAPDNAAYRVEFGQLLATAGLRADAELQYERAIALAPTDPAPYYWLGELYRTWEPPRIEEAVGSYRRAISVAPSSPPARLAEEALGMLGEAAGTAQATPAR